MPTISVPEGAYEKLVKLAEKEGAINVEDLILSMVVNDMDRGEASNAYWEASQELMREAEEELSKGDLRQASEKIWGSAALAVKAVAQMLDGARLASHGELWAYVDELSARLNRPELMRLWQMANSMHVNFYGGWATRRHVEEALRGLREFLSILEEGMRGRGER